MLKYKFSYTLYTQITYSEKDLKVCDDGILI
jgi:hypothetical protein